LEEVQNVDGFPSYISKKRFQSKFAQQKITVEVNGHGLLEGWEDFVSGMLARIDERSGNEFRLVLVKK